MVQCSKKQVENSTEVIQMYPPLCANEGQKTLREILMNVAAVAELHLKLMFVQGLLTWVLVLLHR